MGHQGFIEFFVPYFLLCKAPVREFAAVLQAFTNNVRTLDSYRSLENPECPEH